MRTDAELLRDYAETGSEEAFSELVRRRMNFVYSSAMRQVNGDAHLAQDVAQTVFADLARKAGVLSKRQSLTGWLYTSTHYAAAKAVRTESRRRTHEEEAQVMNDTDAHEPEPDWSTLAPILDEVMHQLEPRAREALLLRYFENRRLEDVGKMLGVSDDGARKRIDRALEKLRDFLLRRGITTSAALATAISAHAIQPAPAGLAATVATKSIAGVATVVGWKLTFWNIMTLSKTKFAMAVLVAGCMTIPIAMQHRTRTRLRDEVRRLQQQLDSAAPATLARQTQADGKDITAPALSGDQFQELLKLRGEVGMLRRQAQELQQANQRAALAASPQSAENGGKLASHSFVALRDLSFAGYATPEAALESVLWAEHQTNLVSYLASLVPENQESEQVRLQTQLDQGVVQPFFHEGSRVTGFQILETNAVSEGQIALTFFVGGQNGTVKLVAKRIGDEWKLYAGPTF